MVEDDEGIRLARRRKVETDVVLRDPEGHGEVSLRCRDISVNGMFVYSSACVSPGSEFIFCMMMDGGLVEAAGRVSRVVLDDDAPAESGMGSQFLHLAREARERLLRFTSPTPEIVVAALAG